MHLSTVETIKQCKTEEECADQLHGYKLRESEVRLLQRLAATQEFLGFLLGFEDLAEL